ncbi:hypothetical protein DFAR_800003 [Desulfarculales bacterium]
MIAAGLASGFNQARRQAYVEGIDFPRPGRKDQCQTPLPQELHGPQTQQTWAVY